MAMEDQEWDRLVRTAPTVAFTGNLSRGIAQLSFERSREYPFASGKRNRCNPAGVLCIYLAENRATALAEYDKYYTELGDHQPCVIYAGNLAARAILDLNDPAVREYFGITEADFFSSFRTNPKETPLEQLGRALTRQTTTAICGLRFPSDARHEKSAPGCNFVIFKQALKAPDSLRILGPRGEILEDWPETTD